MHHVHCPLPFGRKNKKMLFPGPCPQGCSFISKKRKAFWYQMLMSTSHLWKHKCFHPQVFSDHVIFFIVTARPVLKLETWLFRYLTATLQQPWWFCFLPLLLLNRSRHSISNQQPSNYYSFLGPILTSCSKDIYLKAQIDWQLSKTSIISTWDVQVADIDTLTGKLLSIHSGMVFSLLGFYMSLKRLTSRTYHLPLWSWTVMKAEFLTRMVLVMLIMEKNFQGVITL